ncbi:MAG: branched-chain amino acid ABC transporter permease [Desulfomonile sp.]|nr:branched-chain amino acid ABC transporter permease [Desulfomonile sp.]
MTLLSETVQYAISGITAGSIYAVIGICWSVVYLITKVLNFTTGEFVMLGGMLTWAFHTMGFGLPSSVLFAVACTIAISMLLERLVIRPIRFPTEMTYMMLTIASASVIKGLVLLQWGSESRRIEPFFGSGVIHFFGAGVTPQVLCVVAIMTLITLGLHLFLNHTLFGTALRASAINQTGAKLMGIDIGRFRLFCFGLAGGLGAVTGIVTAPITFTGYEIGLLTGLKGLVAAIAGGWSMTGTVAAALALGLLEGFGAGFVSSGLKDVLALIVMILFLILQTISFPGLRRR